MRLLTILNILLLPSCSSKDNLPNDLKQGLLDFSVNKSIVTRQLEDTTNGKTMESVSLWVGFNKLNARVNLDTLFVDVNVELSSTLNYDGGIDFVRDTLFLYAKNLDKMPTKETVHSTLTYKISTQGRTYKEIEFKELK